MQRVSSLSAAVINLRDYQEQQLCLWHTLGPEDIWRWAHESPEAQAARTAVLETEDPKLFELERRSGPQAGSFVGLCLPLRVRDQITGVLEAYGSKALAKKETVETLTSLASQAASALENSRLYEELADRERQLQDLVSRMLVAQEEERRRVAYDVHDGLTQTAVAAYQHLQAFADNHPPTSARGEEELDEVVELVRRTVREARQVIAGLRPTALDDFGLAAATALEVEKLRNEGYQVTYEENLGDKRLPGSVETALFRVAQEALTNVRKHAQAARVRVALRRLDQSVRLEVQDWGRGFKPTGEPGGSGPGEQVGLSSMQERVALLRGRFEVDSEPGFGTSIVAEVPLARTEEGILHG
jgi:signal transduction histidine kinase